ncbi:hypothetical protein HDU97_008421 [Phlyctochytrium planicorne]|nr:hypothetical protein HDU97_008421 [Phlyctochytrium planicorne]
MGESIPQSIFMRVLGLKDAILRMPDAHIIRSADTLIPNAGRIHKLIDEIYDIMSLTVRNTLNEENHNEQIAKAAKPCSSALPTKVEFGLFSSIKLAGAFSARKDKMFSLIPKAHVTQQIVKVVTRSSSRIPIPTKKHNQVIDPEAYSTPLRPKRESPDAPRRINASDPSKFEHIMRTPPPVFSLDVAKTSETKTPSTFENPLTLPPLPSFQEKKKLKRLMISARAVVKSIEFRPRWR